MSSPAPIRISSRTGKPVRKYTKKLVNTQSITTPTPISNVVKYENMECVDLMKASESYIIRGHRVKKYVTGNCQLCCISQFADLIRKSTDLKEQLKEIGKIKPLLFVDIKQTFVSELKTKINNNAIISESNYDSSNGSKMCAIIINTKKLY